MADMKDRSNSKDRIKSRVKVGAAAAVVSLSSFGLMNAVAATATIDIVARLIRAIEITINTSLDFGTLAITDEKAGRATLDPVTNDLFIDNRSSLALSSGTPRAGRLSIRGSEMPISVSMENTQVHLTNGTTFVTVNKFGFVSVDGASGTQLTITPTDAQNTVSVAVGATINTREGQLTGTYVGSNRIFANYQ